MPTSDSPRVRFAPSPTGFLHVGGARTALFNWLYARQTGGVFLLRIEDTDRARSSAQMTRAILDGLQWLGLEWDEGPLHQADGAERHRADVDRLLSGGAAYRCFCTPEELEARREAAGSREEEAFRYGRSCVALEPGASRRRAEAGESFSVRFLIPEGTTEWDDLVHGPTRFRNADIEDFVILRTDGTPTYNLAVVSDDVAMGITHVIRGDDHLSNTPKQILLYGALREPTPVFGHLPMILGADGKRLSKRHGATAVGEYAERGILPQALVNFLALLGWNPGDDREIMTLAELTVAFSLERINKKSAVFDPEKLEWMNSQHLSRLSGRELLPLVADRLVDAGLTLAGGDRGSAGLVRPVDGAAEAACPLPARLRAAGAPFSRPAGGLRARRGRETLERSGGNAGAPRPRRGRARYPLHLGAGADRGGATRGRRSGGGWLRQARAPAPAGADRRRGEPGNRPGGGDDGT